jgi:autotransporter-associated beta strand protein
LTLGGNNTGANEISGAIVNNSVGNTTILTKADGGTWILSGNNTYTGNTTVNAGTLLIGNTVGSSASLASGSTVSVGASGTLGGYGTIGGATTITDGKLAPGASAGSLKFGGTLSLVGSSGAPQTQIELGGTSFTLDSTEQYDRIKLTGATPVLTLAGTLDVSLINSFSLADNQAFGIFQLGSGATRSGTFSGLASDDSLVGTYGGKNLYITYSADFGDSGPVVLTGGNDIALYTVQTIPEPSTWALVAFSLTTAMVLRRRRNS